MEQAPGWAQKAHCCRPSQARPVSKATSAEFRKASRQGSPRPWPGLPLGEPVPPGPRQRGGGQRVAGGAAKQEEPTGWFQVALIHLGGSVREF